MFETEERAQTGQDAGNEQNSLLAMMREGGSLSLADFIGILSRGRRRILYCGLATLALAALRAFTLGNIYSAVTSFVPPGSSGISSSAALMGQLSGLGGAASLLDGGRSQGDLYIGILKSRTTAKYVVEHYGLQGVYKAKKESDAENILTQNSLFESSPRDPILKITVTDTSPVRARDLANGYIQALEATSGQLALGESSQRRLFFEQRLAKEKNDLADAEVALKQVEEKTGLISPGGQTASQIQSMAQLNSQITQLQTELAGLRSGENDQNSHVERLRNEIGSLQGQLKQMQSGSGKDSPGQFSTSKVPGLELDYIRRERDVKYHEALFEIISKQYEAARLDEAKDSPLQILDPAVVPDSKSGPHRTVIMAIGLLIGLLGGTVWVLLRHIRRPQLPVR